MGLGLPMLVSKTICTIAACVTIPYSCTNDHARFLTGFFPGGKGDVVECKRCMQVSVKPLHFSEILDIKNVRFSYNTLSV